MSIVKLDGDRAYGANNRQVKLGPLKKTVKKGDWIEVYADIAVRKMDSREIKDIQVSRKG
jgi:hypothetical protein